MRREKLILAIEAAIGGGSLSLLRGIREIDSWSGSADISRAEDLLETIDALLYKNKLKKDEINLIAVSDSIGSRTGLRIGLATALGLQRSIRCDLQIVPTFDALILSSDSNLKTVLAILSNRHIYWQERPSIELASELKQEESFRLDTFENFRRHLEVLEPKVVFVNRDLWQKFTLTDQRNKFDLQSIGTNLAIYIGIEANKLNASDNER